MSWQPARSADAIHAIFPRTQIQRCVIHQIRQSLKYVTSKEQKVFLCDLQTVYQAATREAAETSLLQLAERWGDQYAIAVRSWETNWEDLATMFDYPAGYPLGHPAPDLYDQHGGGL